LTRHAAFRQRSFIVCALACLSIACGSHAARSQDSLRAGFASPPPAARLRCYWWWLNGNITEDAITRDLTAMKANGFGGAILVDADGADHGGNQNVPAGPTFGSPQWVKLYLHALDVAQKLDLEISLNATSGWNLGGPGVKPEDGAKILTFARTIVEGPGSRTIQLAAPPIVNGFYRPIAVLAYPLKHGSALAGDPASGRRAIANLEYKIAGKDTGISMSQTTTFMSDVAPEAGEEDFDTSKVVDLSAHVTAGDCLQWDFPAGTWEVLRIGYTDSNALVSTGSDSWQGLMIDYMSRTAFDHYWQQTLAPLLEDARPYLGKSLRYLVEDSWEGLGGENWTEGFREEFIHRRGYDPLPYLPAVSGRIVNDRATTDRFLADLRRTVADLIAANHYDYFAELAARYGLGTHAESGGPHGTPIDALRNFRDSSFPQTEFWVMSERHRVADDERFFVKEAASAANLYGKPFAAGEGFTSMSLPWSESPGLNLKPTFDQALTEGLTRLYWHEFTTEPDPALLPGQEYFSGTHLNPSTTWWKQSGPVLLAMNRAQFLMQQGRPVLDLLYLVGDEVPGFARLKSDDPAHVLPGYDYDVASDDALLHQLSWAGGILKTPSGVQYRALALPRSGALSLASLIWIERYVREGGTLIGPRPSGSLGLLNDADEKKYSGIAGKMWRDCNGPKVAVYGAGRIYCTLDAHNAFQAFGISPDMHVDGEGKFDFAHRATSGAEIYFVRNTQNKPAQAVLTFRVRGRVPELWQMDTGAIAETSVYRNASNGTQVPLSFPAYGSVFVVFEHAQKRHVVRVERNSAEVFPSILPGAGVFADDAGALGLTGPGEYSLTFSDGAQRNLIIPANADLPALSEKWTLSFPPGWGAPASIHLGKSSSKRGSSSPGFREFGSWTDSADAGIRYFSGTATYTGDIDVPDSSSTEKSQLWLDLGDAREIATVRIDGKPVATLWHPPFRVRIDQALHLGANSIEIDVSNLWANRVIGDAQPGAHRYTSTNITEYEPGAPLIPSGLLTAPAVYSVGVVDLSKNSQ
jgi:hypothetical protein